MQHTRVSLRRMLFYAFEFIYCFLPLVGLGFYTLGRLQGERREPALLWLVGGSLFFYAWWDIGFVPLLVSSVVLNFVAGQYLHRHKKRAVFIAAIGFNLLLIAYFKYLGFFVGIIEFFLGRAFEVGEVILPLAISFFTFQQIAWLVDNYSRTVAEGKVSFVEYSLFVTFFPQLIAGPIVHHTEMIPQFRDRALFRFQSENFTIGISIFIIGLFKKVVIADSIAPAVNLVFDGAAWGGSYGTVDSWIAALGYSLQLYFDFSGYADMAIGLGLMFNIRLPVNFESPLRACSISEFWRRWHMTLSRFLRTYLYIPMGGNRKGEFNTYLFLFITMCLGGLWHGAGWTFVTWGALHGIFLIINHLWNRYGGMSLPRPLSWLLTFLAVILAFVIFRAHDLEVALNILGSMFTPATSTADFEWQSLLLIGAAMLAVVALPNTRQLVRRHFTPIEYDANAISASNIISNRRLDTLHLEYSLPWLCYLACLGILSIVSLLDTTKVQEFIYFQF